MKTKDHSKSKSSKQDENIEIKDYTVLRSSEKQIKGIRHVSERLAKDLGIERKYFLQIVNEIFTEMQIRESRFHFEMDKDLPQFKLALKKMLEPQLIEKILKLNPNEMNLDILKETIEDLFHWYMKEYLPEN